MAVELPVSDRYAADGPGGADDEGTARKDGEERNWGRKRTGQQALWWCAGEWTGLGTSWCQP